MAEIFIPLFYSILFLYLINKWKIFSVQSPVNKKWIYAAFIFKILAGLGNYWIWVHIIGRGDSLNYIHDADMIYGTLFKHPLDYLQLTFGYNTTNVYPEHLRYISDPLKYSWNNAEYTMVRINSVLHVFTFGNAWANIVILSFFYFTGSILLFKTLIKFFRVNQKLLFAILFFIPSVIFWSSGLLKEGPALLLMSLLIIQLLHLEKQFSVKRWLHVLLILCATLLIRDYIVFLIIPNLIVWSVAKKINTKQGIIFSVSTFCFALLVFLADFFSYKINASEMICEAQQYFIVTENDPDYNFHLFNGYELTEPVKEIPYAVNNFLFRPNFIKSDSLFRVYQSFELILTWIFILFCFIKGYKNPIRSATMWMFIFLSGELLFIYGMIVTDADTLSRYRTFPVFFLLVAAIIKFSGQQKSETVYPVSEI